MRSALVGRPPAAVHAPFRRGSAAGRLVLALVAGLLAGALHGQAPRSLLLDAARAGPDVVAVGERGGILRSTDSGRTWSTISVPWGATLTGVSFASDARHGWAVGHDALILTTADGGRTWRKQWQGANLEASFLDVCALDASEVIAVGAYGLCLATSDGGRTWSPRKVIDDDMHLNRITRGPTGTLYIAGERGTLMRSADRGHTWLRIDTPYDGSFYGILPLGARTLVAYGLRGRVFRSIDDGDTWTPAAIDQPILLATAVVTTNGSVILAGQSGVLYGSRGGVPPFTRCGAPTSDGIAELLQAPDGTLLAFGETGVTLVPPSSLSVSTR